MFIEVMYSNLSRKKVKLEDIDTIPKNNVLFILVSTDQEDGKLKNIASSCGFDYYAVCQKRNKSQDWVMLIGWNDDDFVWRRVMNPHEPGARQQVEAPLGCMNIVFSGVAVKEEIWQKAQKIFNKEMA